MQENLSLNQRLWNNIPATLLGMLFFFNICLLRLCFQTTLILHFLHLDLHLLCRGDTFEAVQGVQYYDHSWTELLFFPNVCSQVALFNESNIALFAFRFSFCHMGDIPIMHTARVTLHPSRQSVWRPTWKRAVERSQTNVTNVIFHHLTLVSESTSVTQHPLKQAIYTYKETRWRKKMNVTLAIMLQLTKVFLWHIWKHTLERNKTSHPDSVRADCGEHFFRVCFNLTVHFTDAPKNLTLP